MLTKTPARPSEPPVHPRKRGLGGLRGSIPAALLRTCPPKQHGHLAVRFVHTILNLRDADDAASRWKGSGNVNTLPGHSTGLFLAQFDEQRHGRCADAARGRAVPLPCQKRKHADTQQLQGEAVAQGPSQTVWVLELISHAQQNHGALRQEEV